MNSAPLRVHRPPQGRASAIDQAPLVGNERYVLERKVLAQVKRTPRFLLRELFDFFQGRADYFPSNARISEVSGISPRNVQLVLRQLEARAPPARDRRDREVDRGSYSPFPASDCALGAPQRADRHEDPGRAPAMDGTFRRAGGRNGCALKRAEGRNRCAPGGAKTCNGGRSGCARNPFC
jgi:hypothetical protein